MQSLMGIYNVLTQRVPFGMIYTPDVGDRSSDVLTYVYKEINELS